MPDDVWNVPASYPVTPAPHATEGYLEFSGYTATPVFYEEAGIRAAKQILGCDYYDGETKTTRLDVEDVEAGRFDDARRFMYAAYKRLWVLNFLCQNWPYAWDSLYGAVEEIGLNYGWYHSFAADGKGTTVYINWTDADTDARKMMLNSSFCPVHPGCVAIQNLNTFYGMAIVTAVQFLGQAGETHRAKLTLHRPLDADAGGKLWIIVDDKLDVLPAFPLRVSDSDLTVPKQCKHAIYVNHTVYSSFKSAYPTLPACSGIHGQWFCDRLDWEQVDLSYFVSHSGRCHNTACPLWEPQEAWYPGDGEAYTKFWLARGRYLVEYWPGAIQDPEMMNLVKHGKDDFTGLGALLGWPIGYWSTGRGASVYIEDKIYSGIGDLLFLTGETTEQGYLEFLNWDQIQTQRVADGEDEDDNVGIIEDFEVVTKADPAGGASYAARVLTDDRPGYDFERTVGVRRLGHIGMGQDSVPAGAGLNGVQSIRPRKFTSAEFELPYVHPNGSLTNDNGETRLTFFAEAQSIGSVESGDEFSYDLLFQIPHNGERAARPVAAPTKAVSGAVNAISVATAGVLRMDFNTGALQILYGGSAGPPPVPPEYQDATCAGNIVRAPLSREILNPAAGRVLGDRQGGLYPGDVIKFSGTGIEDVGLTCVRAEAYGGGIDANAIQPTSSGPGVPAWVTANYNKMDRAWFALDGRNGRLLKKWAGDGGFSAGTNWPIGIASVEQSAVCPPLTKYDGTATGYAPYLTRVKDGVEDGVLVAGTDYLFDPTTGTFYIDSAGWTQPGHEWRLHFAGYVFDRRRTYTCEDAKACHLGLKTIVENDAYIDAGSIFNGSYLGLCKVQVSDGQVVGMGAQYHAPTWVVNPWSWTPQSYSHLREANTMLDTDQVYQWRKYNWPTEGYGNYGQIGDTACYVHPGEAAKDWDEYSGGDGGMCEVNYQHRGFMWAFFPPERWSSAQIGKAYMDVEIGGKDQQAAGYNATITKYTYTYTGNGATGWQVGTQTDAASTNLALKLYRVTYDETDSNIITSLYPLASSELAVFTKLSIDGYNTLRGTVDITSILKTAYLVYWALESNQELCIILAGDDTVGTVPTIQDTITGWANWAGVWDAGMTGPFRFNSDDPYSVGGFTSVTKSNQMVTFGNISLGQVRIHPTWAGLDVCDYPYDGDGHSHGPNIMG